MQNNLIILRNIFFHALFSCYIIFSLVTLQNCKYHKAGSTSEILVQQKQEIAKQMMHEFSAEMFNCNAKSILNKSTILDSLLIGISQEGPDNYLKAEVLTSCGPKYFVKLRCSDEIIEKFNSTKSNHAYLAAKITRIDNAEIYAEADTLDGKRNDLALGSSILLSGECIEINELPMALN